MSRLAKAATYSAVLLAATPCGARTWFVNTSGTGDAPTIQAAADSSSPGDTVLVAPGRYIEQVLFSSPATLRGSGAAATTLDGNTGQPGYCVTAADVLIESLGLEGAYSDSYGYGGYCVNVEGQATIRDCLFENTAGEAVRVCGDLTLQGSTLRRGGGVFFGGSFLTVEDCRFEDVDRTALGIIEVQFTTCGGPTTGRISRNTFVRCGGGLHSAVIGYDHVDQSLDLEVSSNLFAGNIAPAVAFAPLPIVAPRRGRGGTVTLDIRENTIARNTGYTIGWDTYPFGQWGVEVIEVRRNAITGNGHGPFFFYPPSGPVVFECNDVWANGVNWSGIPDPTGEDGNISLEPKYCDAANGNFTVSTNSPLRDVNNSCQAQIGAFGVGCGPIAVDAASWGRIKAAYRSDGVGR